MRKLLLVICLAGSTSRLVAQPEADLQAGSRVRVRSLLPAGGYGSWREGTVALIRPDTVLLQPKDGGDRVLIARSASQIRAFVGRRSSAGRGLGIGLVSGVLSGAVIGFAAGEDCGSGGAWLCFDRGEMAAGGAVFFGGIGAVTGLIVGALSSHDVWRPAGAAGWRPFAGGSSGRLRLGTSLSF